MDPYSIHEVVDKRIEADSPVAVSRSVSGPRGKSAFLPIIISHKRLYTTSGWTDGCMTIRFSAIFLTTTTFSYPFEKASVKDHPL